MGQSIMHADPEMTAMLGEVHRCSILEKLLIVTPARQQPHCLVLPSRVQQTFQNPQGLVPCPQKGLGWVWVTHSNLTFDLFMAL